MGKSKKVPHLDGHPSLDRPLFVQFCANEPSFFRESARLVAPYCDAVDLNLGCPQGIARKGNYGAFLQEKQTLVHDLIKSVSTAKESEVPIPVTAKIRILETPEATLAYAKNVLSAGATILTVHGRKREQKGHLTGLADWKAIRQLRDELPPETVLFANGNILTHDDLEKCLKATGADAVMSAEGALSDPAIFAKPPPTGTKNREYWRGHDGRGGWRVDGVMRRYVDILWKYCTESPPPVRRPLYMPDDDDSWFASLPEYTVGHVEEGPQRKKRKKESKSKHVTSPNLAAIQAHLFHLLRHFVTRHTDVRDMLAKLRSGNMEQVENILAAVEKKCAEGLSAYVKSSGRSWEEEEAALDRKTVSKLRGELGGGSNREAGQLVKEMQESGNGESSLEAVRKCRRPWWVCQPIIRPLPKEALATGGVQISKKKMQEMEQAQGETKKSDFTRKKIVDCRA